MKKTNAIVEVAFAAMNLGEKQHFVNKVFKYDGIYAQKLEGMVAGDAAPGPGVTDEQVDAAFVRAVIENRGLWRDLHYTAFALGYHAAMEGSDE